VGQNGAEFVGCPKSGRRSIDYSTIGLTAMEIRIAELRDSQGIARLCNVLGYLTSADEIATRLSSLLISERHLVVVAVGENAHVSGWIAADLRLILESGERAEIVGLIVDPKVRGDGIGKSLVDRVEKWARESGVSKIVVRSNIARTESHSFFQNANYVHSKTQHVYLKDMA
jgi:N-acetylglutamate synthase-like GNAT family acetyltransferase